MCALPQLPLDVLVCVLSHLPPERTLSDSSARTLARFATCSRLFHDAAGVPSLWEPHYQARFTVSDVAKEEERSFRLADDWRQRYAERKQLESHAQAIVRRLCKERKKRRDPVRQMIDLSMDVWDVLALQAEMPLPPGFGSESKWDLRVHGVVPEAPLSVIYWSKQAKLVLSRSHAIREIQWIKEADGTPEEVPFQDAMCLLSCFFSYAPSSISARIGHLIQRCDEYMEANHCLTDSSEEGYSEVQLCRDIGGFMKSESFGMPSHEQYRRLLNSFPHSYLSDNPQVRKTIPISLIHVFSCLGRHYGLDIDPVNIPGAVLARVNVEGHSPDGFFLVNLASAGPDDFILGAATAGGDTSPSSSVTMLLRASRNMVASMRQREIGFAFADAQWAIFCAFTIQLLLCPEDVEPLSLLRATGHLPYMECYTLLMALAPLLDESRRGPLRSYCERSLMQEEREAITVTPKRRTEVDVKYFIGQVLRHKELEYYGCIIGWDEEYDRSPESMREVDYTDEGYRGQIRRDQPYYRVYRLDDASIRYVPQDCIRIIALTAELAGTFLRKGHDFSKSFSDVHLSTSTNDRGRFLPSPELKDMYPEDEFYGFSWVREGKDAVTEQNAAVEAFAQQFRDYL